MMVAGPDSPDSPDSPEESYRAWKPPKGGMARVILDRRYANGEITRKQYEMLLRDLGWDEKREGGLLLSTLRRHLAFAASPLRFSFLRRWHAVIAPMNGRPSMYLLTNGSSTPWRSNVRRDSEEYSHWFSGSCHGCGRPNDSDVEVPNYRERQESRIRMGQHLQLQDRR